MTTNPYAKYVEGKDPLQCLDATPRHIEAMARQWNAETFERSYAPGKWSARQILIHLAQIEMVFAVRLRFLIAADGYVVQTFEQDDWMAAETQTTGPEALAAYVALRRMNAALCRSLSPALRARTGTHPEFGAITADWLIAWVTGHELNHVPQLETIGRS